MVMVVEVEVMVMVVEVEVMVMVVEVEVMVMVVEVESLERVSILLPIPILILSLLLCLVWQYKKNVQNIHVAESEVRHRLLAARWSKALQ
jgi:hypothetical protein